MTKKSAGRLERDREAAAKASNQSKLQKHLLDNTAWDDLKKTSDSIRDLLNYDSQICGLFFSQEPLMALVPPSHQQRVINSLDTLRTDVITLLEIHRGIAAKHECFSGAATTEEQGLLTQEYYTAYLDIAARFEQLDKPIIDYLNGVRIEVTARVHEMENELAAKAEAKAAEEAQAAAEAGQPEATQG